MQPVVNIGMIGHVDHGKTSLTQALTGKWTDTHSEELKRGISIRLGYADATFYKCPKCKGAEAYATKPKCQNCNSPSEMLRKVSFIDAPGHETLMMTMLSGAALMQGAVLVVAANEPCPQPRTAEHLMALGITGVKGIVVAQNKVDLVDKKQALENYGQIKAFLKEYDYENAEIVPIAANFGINIDLLIDALERTVKTPALERNKPAKMFVVRSFDTNKPGAKPQELSGGVLGGSLMQGVLEKGDKIEISPGIGGVPLSTTCVSLRVSDGEIESAKPGGLIAVGTELDPAITRNDRMRGQMAAKPGVLPEPTTKLVVEIQPLKRLITEARGDEVRVSDSVVLTVGTMTTLSTVAKKMSGKDFAMELKTPVVAEAGQKIAISKKEQGQWRLIAYGVCR